MTMHDTIEEQGGNMNRAFIHGIGMAAPGLTDWSHAAAVLRGEMAYQAEPLPPFRTTLLARNEARRMGAATKLAFRAAEQAVNMEQAADLSAVFASAAADITIADRNCTAVNTPERAVSPTQFHNSVHNAAAGYWSIATGSKAPATSISGGHDSFAVALCEAWAMLAMERKPVLLVCFEAKGQGLLGEAWRDIHDSLALALVLSCEPQNARASLSRPTPVAQAFTPMANPELEQFRHLNPAGRGLSLLNALARTGRHSVVLESTSQDNLSVDVETEQALQI